MGVHQERRALVQRLRKLAKAYNATRVPDAAGKDAVASMVAEILGTPTLSPEDRAATLAAKQAYEQTWASSSSAASPSAVESAAVEPTKEWKFHVLRGLFDRFILFAKELGVKLSTSGLSATMERSKEDHVHLHLYFHSASLFHKRGLRLGHRRFRGNLSARGAEQGQWWCLC